MMRKMVPQLRTWESSDAVKMVVIKGAGERSFCSGGDVAALANVQQDAFTRWQRSVAYFALKYQLDHFIATYRKPYIALIDGITMGGGVGISIHAPFRIATERTVFAMPETAIGFFPDVGASFFLPRMEGSLGTFLGLTGHRITGAEVFQLGIATHFVDSCELPRLESYLESLLLKDDDTLAERLATINEALTAFCGSASKGEPVQLSQAIRRAIDRCFGKANMKDIISALLEEKGETESWARKQIDTLLRRSPTSLHVTLKQMMVGRQWTIAEAFQREHQIASEMLKRHDFLEGVNAVLVRRDEPRWYPRSLDDISICQKAVESFFHFDESVALQLLTDRDYFDYPHGKVGIPRSNEILEDFSKAGEVRDRCPCVSVAMWKL